MSLLPQTLPITIAAAISGVSAESFRRHILPMLETDNGRVVRQSLERNLDRFISAEEYLKADRKLDKARSQQRYRNGRRTLDR